jgi:monolysocardiolipin acyltransferase
MQVLSAATVAAIGLTCKAYLNSGLCSISVRGLPYLLDALKSPERQSGQGVLTGERYHIFFSLPNCEES